MLDSESLWRALSPGQVSSQERYTPWRRGRTCLHFSQLKAALRIALLLQWAVVRWSHTRGNTVSVQSTWFDPRRLAGRVHCETSPRFHPVQRIYISLLLCHSFLTAVSHKCRYDADDEEDPATYSDDNSCIERYVRWIDLAKCDHWSGDVPLSNHTTYTCRLRVGYVIAT